MSRTMARFSSPVVRSARSTCRMSDLATTQTTGVPASSSACTCGSVATSTPALRVAPNATSSGVLQVQLGLGPLEELGVLGHGAGPAALDEAHAELVQQPRDRELVGDRVADALALPAVAQRGVEDLVVHGELPFGRIDYDHNKKTPRGCGRSARRRRVSRRARCQ